MQHSAMLTTTGSFHRKTSLGPGALKVRFRQHTRQVLDGLAHWDDAVAVGKAFDHLQGRVVGSYGIFEVRFSGENPRKKDGREVLVAVMTETPLRGKPNTSSGWP